MFNCMCLHIIIIIYTVCKRVLPFEVVIKSAYFFIVCSAVYYTIVIIIHSDTDLYRRIIMWRTYLVSN